LGERALYVAGGFLKRRIWIVPYEKTQTIRVSRGPVQRALRLSNLLLDTAGSGALVSPEMHDLDEAEAEAMAERLLALFQAARARSRGALRR
jgi:putative membrane protein